MPDDAVSLARRILSEGGYSTSPEAVASLASQLSSYSPGYSAPQGTNAAQPAAPAFSSNPGQQAIDAVTQQPSNPDNNLGIAPPDPPAALSGLDPYGLSAGLSGAFASPNQSMGTLSAQMPLSGIPQGQAHAGFTAGTAFTPDNLVSVPLWQQSGITNPAGRAGATSAPPGVGATGIGSFGLGGPQGDASFQNIADQTAQPGMGPPSQQDINTLAEAGLGEARGQGARGMQDVMSSIVNRADSNYSGFGRNVQQQVDAPSQYSYRGTSNQRAAQQALQGQSPLGKQAQDLAAGLLMGTVPGTVGGRTDYRAQNQGRGVTSTPRADSLVSAGHNFFNNNPALDQLRSQQQQQQNNQVQGQQPAPAPDGGGGGFGGGLIPFAPPQAPAGARVSVPGITGAGASGVGFDGPAPAPPPTPDDSPGIAPGDNSLFGEDPAPPAPSAWDGTGAPQEGGSTPNGAPPPPPDDTPPAPDFSVPAPDLPGPIQGLDPPPPNLGLEAPDAPAPLSGLDPSPPNLGLEAPDAPAPLSGLDAPDPGPSVPGGTTPFAGEDLVSSADMPAPDAVEAQGVGMPGAPDDSAPTASEDDSGDTGSYGSSADSSNDAGDSGGVGGDSGDSGSGGDDGGDGGGDGGGGDGGGGDEHRGGRIVAHALQVVRKRRRHGGPTVQELQSLMTEDAVPDTPHNRQTLHDLGQQNYLNGYNSLTPLQQHQYDVLTRSYNFPPQVGSDDTWEDQVSNRNMHLQEGRDPDIEPDSYADGGAIDQAIAYLARLKKRRGGRAHFDLGGEVDPVTDKPDDDPNEIPSFARGGDVDRALGLTRRRARI